MHQSSPITYTDSLASRRRFSARDVAIHDPIATQLRQAITSAFITEPR